MIIGYGVADAESRAFVMSKAHLKKLFDWQPFCEDLSTLTVESPTYKLLRSYSSCNADHVSLGPPPGSNPA